jgi:hypothetical protein
MEDPMAEAWYPTDEHGNRIGMNHDEQIEAATLYAVELYSAMETRETRGLTWNKRGKLLEKADGHYGRLKELIHEQFGTQPPIKDVTP